MAISKIQDAGVSLTVDAITATGTADATTFLRGDGTWGAVDTTPPTDYGVVGTYVIAVTAGTVTSANTTIAGSSLYRGSTANSGRYSMNMNLLPQVEQPFVSLGLTGTWRSLTNSDRGTLSSSYYMGNLWVRIS